MTARTMIWTLTLSGAIPFVATAGLLWLYDGLALFPVYQALMIYGAIILTFVGAVRWGLALGAIAERPERGRVYLLAVLPAIWSWILVMSGPFLAVHAGVYGLAAGALAMAAGFVAMLAWDLKAVAKGAMPPWYRLLRIVPSAAAVLSLVAAAIAVIVIV